jgi:flagellar motility protein MotE (MotC chaperone)
MRVRLIPVTIGAVAMVLSLRTFDLWTQAGTAFAQSEKPASATSAPAPAVPAAVAGGRAAPAAQPPAPIVPASQPSDVGNIPEYTDAEIQVLQSLSGRREALEQRGTELEQREALLKAAEQRIDAKVQELKQLQGAMESLIRRYDEDEEARKKSLVKIFETMKPAEAARIFEQMDLPVLVDLIDRMKERNAAPVLAQMHPARAKQVTAELARRRQPGPQAAAQGN